MTTRQLVITTVMTLTFLVGFLNQATANEVARPTPQQINATIPDGVASLDRKTFGNNFSLRTITLSSSVTNIAQGSLKDCRNLEAVNVDKKNKIFSSVKGVLYNKNKTSLIHYPRGKLGHYTILSGVTNIEHEAFYYCNGLTGVTIPGSLASVDGQVFAFCHNLTTVKFNRGVNNIGAAAFRNCTKLVDVTIPNSVTNIGPLAFGFCTNLTEVTIPASVTSYKDSNFSSCHNLRAINVHKSNTRYSSLGGVLFDKNKSTLIRYPYNKQSDYSWFARVFATKKIKEASTRHYDIPFGVTRIGDKAFSNCNNLTSVSIPTTVTCVDNFAFINCQNLSNITIPESVKQIGFRAFDYCNNLTNVALPSTPISVGIDAFANCTNLPSATRNLGPKLPKNHASIYLKK